VTPRVKLALGVGASVLALAGALYALLQADDDEEPPAAVATTTTEAPHPRWPLTGEVAAPDAPVRRPALAVKISNSSAARPQAGIAIADQVWEERVEGITRFIAVFHSTGTSPVGPVRSARDSDIDILAAFGRPIFVWGGANEGVAARVEAADVVSYNIDPDAAEDKFRDEERPAPDDLFLESTRAFWAKAEDASPARSPLSIGTGRRPPPGEAGDGVTIDLDGTQVAFVWDPGREGWARIQDGTPHVSAEGDLVAPTNVVVLSTEYGAAPSDPASPMAITIGTGDATLLIAGKIVDATWSRPTAADGFTFTDDTTGRPVRLAPGRSWVSLPEPGATARLDPAQANQLRAQLPPP
jgi:hypothetical protein